MLKNVVKNKDSNDITVEKLENILELNQNVLSENKNVKKYKSVRRIFNEILDSMEDYCFNNHFSLDSLESFVIDEVGVQSCEKLFSFDENTQEGARIFYELFIFNNHSKVTSLVERYLSENKFKSEQKKKMLKCMKESYASLFKVIDYDANNALVFLEDVFNKRSVRIIDLNFSKSMSLYKKGEIYIYSRIIKYNGVAFTSGLPIIMTSQNEALMDFIVSDSYYHSSGIVRCLVMYQISKLEKNLVVVHKEMKLN